MNKFKKGDKLECIEPGYNHDLTLGQVYIYDKDSLSDRDCVILESPNNRGFYRRRFKLVDSKPKPSNLPF